MPDCARSGNEFKILGNWYLHIKLQDRLKTPSPKNKCFNDVLNYESMGLLRCLTHSDLLTMPFSKNSLVSLLSDESTGTHFPPEISILLEFSPVNGRGMFNCELTIHCKRGPPSRETD